MGKLRKFRKNLIVLFILIVIVFFISVWQSDFREVFKILKSINVFYFSIATFLSILYIFLNSHSLRTFIKKINNETKILAYDSYLIGNTANFFNAITPFQAGGQPMQVYFLNKVGVKTEKATSIVMINFIVNQITIVFLAAVFLSLNYKLLQKMENFSWLIIIGFSINMFVLLFLVLMSISKNFNKFFVDNFLFFISKIKCLKIRTYRFRIKTRNFVDEFQNNFKLLFKYKWTFIYNLMIRLVSYLIFFSIPFFIFKAINYDIKSSMFFDSATLSCFNFSFMSFMPTPGATAGAEVGFVKIFSIFNIQKEVLVACVLVWRFLTYYLHIIIGFVSYCLLNDRIVKKKKLD